jgi:hypothetical protein
MNNENQNTQIPPNDVPAISLTPLHEDAGVAAEINELNKEPSASVVTDVPVMAGQNTASTRIVQTKSHKKLIISLLLFITVITIGTGGFAYWYFGIRTPDIEYEKASAIVDSLITDAKSLQDARSSLDHGTTTKSTLTSIHFASIKLADAQSESTAILNKISDAKDIATEYLTNQKMLLDSKVISGDGSVAAVYAVNKKVIEEYGTSSDVMYKTGYIFYMLVDNCLVDMKFVPTSSQNGDDYAQQAKLCKDYLNQTKSVPAKEFNDTFYVPYKNLILGYIENVDLLYQSTQGSKAWNQAIANLVQIGKDVKNIDTSKVDTIKNSQNPTAQLEKLKSKIEERKKVFFR